MAAMMISGLSASAMAAKTTRVARARVSAKAPVFSVKASSSRARASATMASARAPVALGRSSARRSVIPASSPSSVAVVEGDGEVREKKWSEMDIHELLDQGLGSIMLLGATALSLFLANSAMSGGFIGFWEHFHIGPASLGLHLNAHEWVNEGLMAIFFFMVGLEIKREFVFGSLSNVKAALLPCFGALGGMVAPMGIYLALNSVTGGIPAGWAIPMATDIAFAMGVYNFFKNRMPPAVATFLLTLATVDDLGAIAVIAVCFAKGIVPAYLAASAGICAVLAICCKKKVSNMIVYSALGVALWFALLKGGINADIAGVVAALAIPADADAPAGSHAHAFEDGMKVTLIDDLIHFLHPISSMLIMPLFALANCAVVVQASAMAGVFTAPVGQGIMAGLLVGKPLGIAAICMAAIKMNLCSFPPGMNLKHMLTVGMLAGIGFTMSLFLIEQALVGMPVASVTAKLAILVSSGIAATVGGFAMTRFPVYFCEIVCDDDGCAPELFEEAKFKSENDCDEDGCIPKFDEPVSAVTGEAKKEQ